MIIINGYREGLEQVPANRRRFVTPETGAEAQAFYDMALKLQVSHETWPIDPANHPDSREGVPVFRYLGHVSSTDIFEHFNGRLKRAEDMDLKEEGERAYVELEPIKLLPSHGRDKWRR